MPCDPGPAMSIVYVKQARPDGYAITSMHCGGLNHCWPEKPHIVSSMDIEHLTAQVDWQSPLINSPVDSPDCLIASCCREADSYFYIDLQYPLPIQDPHYISQFKNLLAAELLFLWSISQNWYVNSGLKVGFISMPCPWNAPWPVFPLQMVYHMKLRPNLADLLMDTGPHQGLH